VPVIAFHLSKHQVKSAGGTCSLSVFNGPGVTLCVWQ
jgi:hypothetical protein